MSKLTSTLIAGIFVLCGRFAFAQDSRPTPVYRSIPLADTRLSAGELLKSQSAMTEYLASLEIDRLMFAFRKNAGLPTPGSPLAGWEDPECELRGHFVGHVLSALSLNYAATGSPRMKEKALALVAELDRCQKACGSGYLSAFPESFIDRVARAERVWAPWYTLHKILAGLVDVARTFDDEAALRCATKFAAWTKSRLDRLSDAEVQKMLDTEFGGMTDALADLFSLTKDPAHLETARRFEHRRILDPLIAGRDALRGLHANTQVPKILGAARIHQLTGDPTQFSAARNFFETVVRGRTFATGGTSNYEYWRSEPYDLADQVSDETHENCVTHNMIKLARRLFEMTGDVDYLDYAEGAFWNGILGTHHPKDVGSIMYYVPMLSGLFRCYSESRFSYVCCSGTGIESFSKLADGVYFEKDGVFLVADFVASEVLWRNRGIRFAQITDYPDESTTKIVVVDAPRPQAFELRIRRPRWAIGPAAVLLNGTALSVEESPKDWIAVEREFRAGDVVEVRFPRSLSRIALPGDPSRAAIVYGSTVLAARMGRDGLSSAAAEGLGPEAYRMAHEGARYPAPRIDGPSDRWSDVIEKVPGDSLRFRARTADGVVELIPFSRIHGERYAIYLDFAPEKKRRAGDLDRVSIGDLPDERRHNVQAYVLERGKTPDGGDFAVSPLWLRYDLEIPAEPCAVEFSFASASLGTAYSVSIDGDEIVRSVVSGEATKGIVRVRQVVPEDARRGKKYIAVMLRPVARAEELPPDLRKEGLLFGKTPALRAIEIVRADLAQPTRAAAVAKSADSPFSRACIPVPFTDVHVNDAFWSPRLSTSKKTTIPYAFKKCEETGRIGNFVRAAGREKGGFVGDAPFDDSDVYKIIEGASYALLSEPDPELDRYLDDLIEKIGAAQEKDGYLYTARTLDCKRLEGWMGKERWKSEAMSHELYNAGHLFEAAVAHHAATKKRSLLAIAIKFADCIDAAFGPGKLAIPPGHQVIELGLAKLATATGNARYAELARFFLDCRGKFSGRDGYGEYSQDHLPVREQKTAVGHAVRAGYMYAAMADIARQTDDADLWRAIETIWRDVVEKKLYITGGIGATGAGEAFGGPFELPNASAYCETCAQIANVYWNHRMFVATGHAKYVDVLELSLYNGVLSGIGLDGKSFFYPNPLATFSRHARSPWFGCACCPSNVSRFIPSVAGYAYATRDRDLLVNLYMAGTADVTFRSGEKATLTQKTDYPWDGRAEMTIGGPTPLPGKVRLRIPGWTKGEITESGLYRSRGASDRPKIFVNGEEAAATFEDGYAVLDRPWKSGDTIRLDLPFDVRVVSCDERVVENRNRIAFMRGPIVYCVESVDVASGRTANLVVDPSSEILPTRERDLLGGVVCLDGTAKFAKWDDVDDTKKSIGGETKFRAVPYSVWAHRGADEMAVWLPSNVLSAIPRPRDNAVHRAKKTASFNQGLVGAVGDQMEVTSSADKSRPFFHFWPHFGSTEWVQYDFARPTRFDGAEVYFLNDLPHGGCDLPESWRILAQVGDEWKPVEPFGKYTIGNDGFQKVVFKPVTTSALRLEMKLKDGLSAGVHEWRLYEVRP